MIFFEILDEIQVFSFEKITMATNGMLLKKFADKINRSCLTDLGVSIDGLKDTNDRIRGVVGYFDRTTEGLRLIKDKRITIMTTLNNTTHRELPELLEICERSGYLWDYNLPDNRIYFLEDTQTKSIWPLPTEVDALFDVIKKSRRLKCSQRLSDVQLDYAYRYLKGITVEEPHCFMGFMELFLDSQGNVLSGCHLLPPVGNIMKNNILDILESNVYRKRVRNMLVKKCRGCTCGYGVNVILENLPKYVFQKLLIERVRVSLNTKS